MCPDQPRLGELRIGPGVDGASAVDKAGVTEEGEADVFGQRAIHIETNALPRDGDRRTPFVVLLFNVDGPWQLFAEDVAIIAFGRGAAAEGKGEDASGWTWTGFEDEFNALTGLGSVIALAIDDEEE